MPSPSFGLDLALTGDLAAEMQRTLEEMKVAAMTAADELADWGKHKLRADVEAAGLGTRVANSWRGEVFPPRGKQSLGPAVVWKSNAPQIIHAFSEGAEIIPVRGSKYLAIPTDNAPRGVPRAQRSSDGGRANLVKEAERRFGRLRTIFPKGKRFALIVADGLRRRKGARGGFARASQAARRRGDFEDGVVMFVLVPRAVIKRRLNTGAIEDQIQTEAFARFTAAFYRIINTHFPQEGA